MRRFTKIGLINEIWQIFRYLAFFKKPMFPILVVFGIVAICMLLFFPPYWKTAPPTLAKNLPTGIVEDDGWPWIGAENPLLTIVEYSDYQCFQCRKIHYHLRQLVNQYPDKLRLVHVNFPMDHVINPLVEEPFHVGSAILAAIAEYAKLEGNFWEVSDKIFDMIAQGKTSFTGEDLALATGIPLETIEQVIKRPDIAGKVYIDIMRGVIREVKGTPSFLINGVLYEGDIPAEIFHSLTAK